MVKYIIKTAFSKKCRIFASLIILFLFLLISYFGPIKLAIKPKNVQKIENFKIILLWNSLWYYPNWLLGIEHESSFEFCHEEKRCKTLARGENQNEDMLIQDSADAILFHAPSLQPSHGVPTHRRNGQLWIFAAKEPPTMFDLSRNLALFKANSFNLTMSYRRDSDIYWPYGREIPIENTFKRKAYPVLPKAKVAAWFVSNCKATSGRHRYYRELAKYLPIDVYGACGNLKCGHKDTGPEALIWRLNYSYQEDVKQRTHCFDMVEEVYSFYLSFENSFCWDYVTEKFFEPFKRNIIPVTLGSVNYKLFGPKGTYVDVRDFASPKKLSQHLLALHHDTLSYKYMIELKYALMKDKGMFVTPAPHPYSTQHAMCDLCKMLHQNHKTKEKYYSDIYKWWENNKCYINCPMGYKNII